MSTTAEKPADTAAVESEAKPAESKSTMKAEKVPALKLTLGGAPETWHVVGGVGYVHSTIPSPVGGKGEPTLEVAEKLARDKGCEVTLVRITPTQADEARAKRNAARTAEIDAARDARRAGKTAPAAEAEKFATEVAAAAGKE